MLRCGFIGCGDLFSRPFIEALQRWDVLAAAGEPVDLAVMASHGKILTPEQLAMYPRGVINMHPSLLPAYRGAAPAEVSDGIACLHVDAHTGSQWQLLRGELRSGVTALLTTAKMDAGPVLAQDAFELTPHMTRDDLLREAAARGVAMLERLLRGWEEAVAQARPQQGRPTKAPKVMRALSRVDWETWGVEEMMKRHRALSERFGGLECEFEGKVVKLAGKLRSEGSTCEGPGMALVRPGEVQLMKKDNALRVRLKDGCVAVPVIGVAGSKATMDAASFYRGYLHRKKTPGQFT